jgi:F0F1-type ATP synthase membrane subunit a
MTVRITKILLPVFSIVLLAPFVVVALVALVVELYSAVVHPVSLSFRFFGGHASTSFLSLPHPLTAVAMLIGSATIIFVAFRSRR